MCPCTCIYDLIEAVPIYFRGTFVVAEAVGSHRRAFGPPVELGVDTLSVVSSCYKGVFTPYSSFDLVFAVRYVVAPRGMCYNYDALSRTRCTCGCSSKNSCSWDGNDPSTEGHLDGFGEYLLLSLVNVVLEGFGRDG
jgi:hypothetical protein